VAVAGSALSLVHLLAALQLLLLFWDEWDFRWFVWR